MGDNWKHRSTEMQCSHCMYFVPKAVGETDTTLGRCRKHSPTLDGWPAVFTTDWCGDHKMDENKV